MHDKAVDMAYLYEWGTGSPADIHSPPMWDGRTTCVVIPTARHTLHHTASLKRLSASLFSCQHYHNQFACCVCLPGVSPAGALAEETAAWLPSSMCADTAFSRIEAGS